MDNIYKLKTQLEEAARYANSSVLGHDRMAVILMDNFVELQLGRQMFFKFRIEFLNDYKDLKYPIEKRNEILFKHDKLLNVCQAEGLIDSYQQNILTFCHEIRNRLYHRGDEDEQLIKVALYALHEIIVTKQSEWRGGTDMIRVSMDADWEHPFTKKRREELRSMKYETGSKEDWLDFVQHNFDILSQKHKVSQLLSEFLINGIKRTRSAMDFALEENEQNWDFDQFMLHYSFKVKYRDQLQRITEMRDEVGFQKRYDELFTKYQVSYRPLRSNRIDSFEKIAKSLSKLSSGEAIHKYLTIRLDYFLVHDSMVLARQERQRKIMDMVETHLDGLKNRAKKNATKKS